MKAMEEKKTKYDPHKYYGRRFVLTVHGQHKKDFNSLKSFFDQDFVDCAVIAREFGSHKIHPHWQAYFEIKERRSLYWQVHDALEHDAFHLEVARGTREACVNYIYAVDKEYEAGFVDYNKNLRVPDRYQKGPAEFWNNLQLKPFQQAILDIACSPVNRRDIYYFFEEKGNVGKTIIAEYLHIFHGAIITGGKDADMKHAITRWQQITGHSPVIIVVDIARSQQFTAEACKAIESIKNGLFFDGKYESVMTHAFQKPHVFIFSNKAPDTSLFSEDRWKIFQIMNEKLISVPVESLKTH